MKIGIDCRIFTSKFTGIGVYTYEIVTRIIDHYKNSNTEIVLFLNENEINSIKNEFKNVKKVIANEPHYSISEQTTFLHKLNKEKIDLMFFPHFNLPFFYRKPYIVTIHDMTLSFFPGKKKTKFYHKIAYSMIIKNAAKRAKDVIAISNNTKKDISNILKIDSKKISVVYNGVSETFCKNIDYSQKPNFLKKYNIKSNYILYTGVWRYHKNLPNLIEAFNLIKDKKNIQLVITGKSDPFYPETLNLIKKYNLQENVVLTGFVPDADIENLYAFSTAYVFPSLYEGFGLPPLEAMKCKVPVIASNLSSIPEVCGVNNAIYFDPKNIHDIAEKILYALDNPLKIKELVDNGTKHVSNFSWDKTANEVIEIIEKNV